jgi:PAS domain-containing protein
MTAGASSDRRRSTRGPLWTIDISSGQILDWNDEASELCGWKRGVAKRAFDDLGRLLRVDDTSKPQPVTIREIVGLSTAGRGGRLLQVRLRRPNRSTRHLALEALAVGFRRHASAILLIATPRSHEIAEAPGIGTFAATIGHELSNILVPLYGYTELAAQSPMREDSVKLCLAELRNAAGRVKAIALDLESLAETESSKAPVLIERCLTPIGEGPSDSANLDWHCRTDILVAVNQLQARRAVQALIRIGGRTSSPLRAVISVLPKDAVNTTQCVVCHAVLAGADNFVIVQKYGVRAVSAAALNDPFGSERAGGCTRRLSLAVLVHCGHLAGGHLFLAEQSDSLSLAFPQA